MVITPFYSFQIYSYTYSRITAIVLTYAAILIFNTLSVTNIGSGVTLFSGLIQMTTLNQIIELLLYVRGRLILIGITKSSHLLLPTELSLLILFTTIGTSCLLSSFNLISLFLAIELQSFGLYLLSTLYRKSNSGTAAGLKYFMLGGLSSAIILLGSRLIYSTTGMTDFESIGFLISSMEFNDIGFVLICIGLRFKIAAAPFYNWAPDVYDGVPTLITSWIATIPKISILVIILNVSYFIIINGIFSSTIFVFSALSLLVGTIGGLTQSRIKRLLAFSTISHVGFLLLALRIYSQSSIDAFLFYLIQYTATNVNVFLILIAFQPNFDIKYINQLSGLWQSRRGLSIRFTLTLFSMAGIPPLIGFFAKQTVLSAAIQDNNYGMRVLAILVSVISASYYLKIIQVLFFTTSKGDKPIEINSFHATTIRLLTSLLTFYMFSPIWFVQGLELVSLTLFNSLYLFLLSILWFTNEEIIDLLVWHRSINTTNMNSITLYIFMVPSLVIILLLVNVILAIHKPDAEKVTPYECGFSPVYGQTRNPFSIRFYLVAILFLVFDLEVTRIWPLATRIYQVTTYGYWLLFLFFSILTIGFVYEFGSGALYFTDRRSSVSLTSNLNYCRYVLMVKALLCKSSWFNPVASSNLASTIFLIGFLLFLFWYFPLCNTTELFYTIFATL